MIIPTDALQLISKKKKIGGTQVDGEYRPIHTRDVGIRILEVSLKVLIPGEGPPQNKYALNYL